MSVGALGCFETEFGVWAAGVSQCWACESRGCTLGAKQPPPPHPYAPWKLLHVPFPSAEGPRTMSGKSDIGGIVVAPSEVADMLERPSSKMG